MSLYLQPLLDVHEEIIGDGFAGGGGGSSAIEQALGRPVDFAINHDPAAISMHEANHPQTKHYVSDIFEVDPRAVAKGRRIGFMWFSPDCTDFSKAKGGKPVRTRKRRSLAWVVLRWAGQVRPRVITLENVEEFQQWGPLVGPPDGLRPCPRRRGRRFRRFIYELRRLGYDVDWRELRACDYGAPTIRKRWYCIARCDGAPIVWPEATHGDPKSEGVRSGRLKPWRTAAECIDWTIPMLSIFASKEEARAWGKYYGQNSPIRPLAENTQRRIARGVKRYVLDAVKPFLVTLAHGEESATGKRWGSGARDLEQPFTTVSCSNEQGLVSPVISSGQHGGASRSATDPLHTVTASDKDTNQLIAPHLMTMRNAQKPFNGADEPTHTITAEGATLNVVAPYLVPRYGEREGQEPRTRSVEDPAPVVVPDGNGAQLVGAHITKFRSGSVGHDAAEPLHTVTANSNDADHKGGSVPLGVVAAHLSTYYGGVGGENRGVDPSEPLRVQGTENRFGLVASFLGQHNGGYAEGNSGDGRDLQEPSSTISTKGPHQSVVAAHIQRDFGTSTGAPIDSPAGTITSEGNGKLGVVATFLDQHNNGFENRVGRGADEPVGTVCAHGSRASVVGAFLSKYFGEGTGQALDDPAHTLTSHDRFGLVTVTIEGQPYVVDDIAMRMLQPRELYLAQGFRPGYIIDRGADGRKLTKTEQVRMCGNSVSPPVAEALVRANVPELIARPELRMVANVA